MLVGCPTRIVLTPTDVADAGPMSPGEAGVIPGDAGTDDAESEASDGAYVDNCFVACLNLRRSTIHCPTAFSVDGGEDCVKSCRHARDSRLMPLDISCASKARTLQEAHVCKGWGC